MEQEQLLTLPPPQQHQQQQMEGLQLELRNVAAAIAKVEMKIEVVEDNIQSVERDIKIVEEKLENNMSSSALNDEDKLYFQDKLKVLREKQKDLREKEKDLRAEKQALRNKEEILLQQQQPNQSHSRPPLHPNTSSNDGLSTMALKRLEEVVDEIKASLRATPQVSASYLGRSTIEQLKKIGCFVAFSCPSPPHSDDMDKAQDPRLQQRSVLTLAQQESLLACKTEHQVVAFITPYLEELVHEQEHYVVVNSEEYKWLEIGDDAPAEYRRKPDLFVGHEAIVTSRPPFYHKDTKLLSMRRQTDKFGVLTHWKLRSCIGMTCEAKQTIDTKGFGQIINYGSHICRHGYRVHEDGPDLTRLMLFDKKEFWLITVIRGFPSYVTTCPWTTSGSFDLIRNFIIKPQLMTVLDQACEHFQVKVVVDDDGSAFLGAGAFGFVFRVKWLGSERRELFALKICVSGRTGSFDNVTRLDHEYVQMRKAYDVCPNIVMRIEEGGFQQLVDKNNKEVGAALLMSHVGTGYIDLSPHSIVNSLKELHSKNILHGDASLANVVNVNGNPVWIDFCESVVATLPRSFKNELEKLEAEVRKEFGTRFVPY